MGAALPACGPLSPLTEVRYEATENSHGYRLITGQLPPLPRPAPSHTNQMRLTRSPNQQTCSTSSTLLDFVCVVVVIVQAHCKEALFGMPKNQAWHMVSTAEGRVFRAQTPHKIPRMLVQTESSDTTGKMPGFALHIQAFCM
uniref:Uncharacterized protein n=1 Tax=Eutreptiella gymnastica TaxID=73025 RepID=A0A6T2B4I2_9EUGL